MAFFSANHIAPNAAVESFLLAPLPEGAGPSAAGGPVAR
jgi:hypothetical protein